VGDVMPRWRRRTLSRAAPLLDLDRVKARIRQRFRRKPVTRLQPRGRRALREVGRLPLRRRLPTAPPRCG
jgi:hypothetical protein